MNLCTRGSADAVRAAAIAASAAVVTRALRVVAGAGVTIGSLVLASAAPEAHAIDIVLVYDNANSVEPANDPNGTLLMSVAQAAAARWEDIVEDNYTMTLNIRYSNVPTANAPIINTNTAGNRTLNGIINFSNTRNWWFDPTPNDDSEFTLQQTLFRDLTPAQQTSGFNSTTAEPLLEVGFRGNTNATAPAAAVNNFDAFSTVMHEIGHHMGVTNQFTVATNEWADGDYDMPPSLLAGAVMGVRTGDNFGHLQPTAPLLSAVGVGTGVRRLIGATDVFAAAAVSGWSQIDLQRQDFLVGTNWNTAGNWEGNQVPGSADDVFVRHGRGVGFGVATVTLSTNAFASNLLVAESTNVVTGANKLDVGGTTSIIFDGTFPFPQIFVDSGGELESNVLVIQGGELDMRGGLADLNSVAISEVSNLGSVSGFGTVDVQNLLINDGAIIANNGTLTLTTTSGGIVWNLDGGGGNGEVRATAGDLVINGRADAFSGTMTIGAGRSITMNQPFTVASDGDLRLNGGTTTISEARLTNTTTRIDGRVTVDKRAEINAPIIWGSTAQVSLPQSDDRLEMGTSTAQSITYEGGTFSGAGTLVQNGHAIVANNANVLVNVGAFDWDGATISNTTINPGATLTINSAITDPYDGIVNVERSNLTVNAPGGWSMDGPLNVNPSGFGNALVGGSTLSITSGGTMTVAGGTARVDAPVGLIGNLAVAGIADFNEPVNLGSASRINLTNNGVIRFNDNTNYNGGTIAGTGAIQQTGTGFVVASQAINLTGVFDMDGAANNSAFFINPGTSLTLNVNNINIGNNVYSGDLNLIGGTINVATSANEWTMAGTLDMTGASGQGGIVLGSPMTVTGTVTTANGQNHFLSTTTTFQNTSRTTVAGGTTLNFNAPVTYNGGTHTGGGAYRYADAVNINSGAVLNLTEIYLAASGSLAMSGGRLSTHILDRATGAPFNFSGGSITITGQSTFNDNSLAYGGTNPANTPNWRVVGGGHSDARFSFRMAANSGEFAQALIDGHNGLQPSTLRGAGGGGGADLVVGQAGNATLTVSGGALADFGDDFIIGQDAGAVGAATITGTSASFRSTVNVTRALGNAALWLGGSDGAATTGHGTLHIRDGALVDVGGDASVGVRAGGAGSIHIAGAQGGFNATLRTGDDMAVGGTPTTPGGSGFVQLSSGGRIDVADQFRVHPAGAMHLAGGSLSATALDFDGSLRFTLSNDLGHLSFSSVADLGGELIVDLLSGFTALPGDSFPLMTFGSRSGDFATLTNDTGFAGLSFQRVFTGTSLSLSADALGGDANLDGIVNLQDFNILAGNFGASGVNWLMADFTGDGIVNLQDFNILAGNFGLSAASDVGGVPSPEDWATLASAVPEPAALGWGAVITGALLNPRRRAHRTRHASRSSQPGN